MLKLTTQLQHVGRGLLGLGLVALTMPTPLAAQQAGAGAIEEIIVTTRRRAESLEDVPLVIDVFTEETIEAAGIDRPSDFLNMTPNVLFIDTTNVGETQVHMRGIINPRDTEPPYALVVDGILQPNLNALNQELVDIQQIEVVKGPVGALYGRNALGGAIIVTTKKPTDEVEGTVEVGVGNAGFKKASALISGPIAENQLYGRLSASYNDIDGHYDNEFLGEEVDFFEEKAINGRLLWDLDETEVDLRLRYSEVDGSAVNFNLQNILLAVLPGPSGLPPQPQFGSYPTGVSLEDTSLPFRGNVRSFNEQERLDLALKIEREADWGTVTGIVSFNDVEESLGSEGAFNGNFFAGCCEILAYTEDPGDGVQYQERNEEDFNFTLQFASPQEERLRYNLGLYFAQIERETLTSSATEDGTGFISRVQPAFVANGDRNDTVSLLWGETENDVLAVYGQVAYDVTDTVELALAARWDQEDKTNTNLVPDVISAATGLPLTQDPGLVRQDDFDKFQPKVSVRWNATEDFTVFGSYGLGFRSGGFNNPGSRNAVLTIDGLPNTSLQDTILPEEVTTFEVGFKSFWADRRVTINAAAFFNESEDTHYFQFFPVSLVRAVSNISKTETSGVEVEFNAAVTENLDIFGGFGITDSEIKEIQDDPVTAFGVTYDPLGKDMPFTPDRTINLGLQHTANFGDLQLTTRIDYQQIGETAFDIFQAPGTVRDPVDLVNLRLSLGSESWTVTAWAKNLFDEEWNVECVCLIFPDPIGLGPAAFVHKAPPRAYGVDVRWNFGGR